MALIISIEPPAMLKRNVEIKNKGISFTLQCNWTSKTDTCIYFG